MTPTFSPTKIMNFDPNAPASPFAGYQGITIRAEIASRIMAALSSKDVSASWELLASASVKGTDALIAELNKPVEASPRED